MFEKIIEEVTSPISGKIKVVSFLGNKRIMVDGLVQSGGLMKPVWKKALSTIDHQPLTINHCLILGLGGGTLAHLINQKWPEAEIIGVEIDKEMIRLGKKHFALDQIPNLKIINQDAYEFITDYSLLITHYSLVFLDLYLGKEFPEKFEQIVFLKKVGRLLEKDGTLIINRLFYGKEKIRVEAFVKRLESVFPRINLLRTHTNLLIFLKKR